MSDQDFISRYFVLVFPLYFIILWTSIFYALARIGGWQALLPRFRTTSDFTGAKWGFQSALMRFGVRYNNALTVGADSQGLFIQPFLIFRAWHPPLFIPWTEITSGRRDRWYGKFVEYRLGRDEGIPFTVREKLAQKIQNAARQNWATAPIY